VSAWWAREGEGAGEGVVCVEVDEDEGISELLGSVVDGGT
jgi:hypothetical protein